MNNSDYPKPIPFGDNVPPDIPVDLVPGILGEYSAGVADAIQVPLGTALFNVIGTVAAVGQSKFAVVVNESHIEPLSIYLISSSAPGERKSAAKEHCRFPLRELENEDHLRLEKEILQATAERQVQEEVERGLIISAKKCKSVEERKKLAAKIADLRTDMKEMPTPLRLLADDTTPEALAALMGKNYDRVAVIEAEAGLIDILAGRYTGGAANIDLVLKAWGGESVRIDRRHAEPLILNNPLLTLVLSIQPEALGDLTKSSIFRGRGLLARFLFLVPKSLVGNRRVLTTPIPECLKNKYRSMVRQIFEVSPLLDEQKRIEPYGLKLDNEAMNLWLDFSQYIEHQLNDGGILFSMKDWGGKLPGQILRLAGIVHLTLFSTPQNHPIDRSLMVKMIDLAHVLIPHAQVAYDLAGTDEGISCAKAMLKWLGAEKLERFSAREALNKVRGRWPKMEMINQGLTILEDRAYIFPDEQEATGPGRPTRKYLVNPEVFGSSSFWCF